MEVSPIPGNYPPTSVLELTVENARDAFEGYAASSINIVNAVLPDMLKQEGALLFTTGFSSLHPFPMMGNIGVGLGACATISPIFIPNCYRKVFSSVTVHWLYSFQNRGQAKLVIRMLLLTCGINPIQRKKYGKKSIQKALLLWKISYPSTKRTSKLIKKIIKYKTLRITGLYMHNAISSRNIMRKFFKNIDILNIYILDIH
ncbi:hypothetical protein PilKf_00595 [Pillotina sp. SPG140]